MTRSQVLIIAVFVVAVVLMGYKRMSALGPTASQPIVAPQFDEPLATHSSTETATYDQVTTETTGHAESVQITFDPSKITYGTLLRIFFSVAHDPTQLNRQGPDVGTSYRSVIFYSSELQHKIAQQYIQQLDGAHAFPAKIVTEVSPLKAFYKAEDYHQSYFANNPQNPYCAAVIQPKLYKFAKDFTEKIKPELL